jgi:hypothetical protein
MRNTILLVEVIDAVDLVVKVDGEGHAVETIVADAAPETTCCQCHRTFLTLPLNVRQK